MTLMGGQTENVSINLDDRIERMLHGAVRAYPVTVLVGHPGTGKGTILTRLVAQISANPSKFGFSSHATAEWPDPVKRSPDESTTLSDLVGGFVPDSDGGLRWSGGFFTDAIATNRWIVLDELNRGDLDRILGPLLPWLAGESVELGTLTPDPTSARILLTWDNSSAESYVDPVEGLDVDPTSVNRIVFAAGRDFRMLGTYNPLDAHRVFPLGIALGRRLKQIPIPPISTEHLRTVLAERYTDVASPVLDRVARIYNAHRTVEGTMLGPAAFLEMPRYVKQSLDLIGAEQEDESEPLISELIQEAYVLNVGRFLSMYSPDRLSALVTNEDLEAGLGTVGATWVREALINFS